MSNVPAEFVQALAFDVATGFFEKEELAVKYDLTLEDLAFITEQTAFKKAVVRQRFELDDDGSAFRRRARALANDALTVWHTIAEDEDLSATHRIKAAEKLVDAASFKYMRPSKDGGASVPQIVINTNLALGGESPGRYVAQARIVEGEVESAEDLLS